MEEGNMIGEAAISVEYVIGLIVALVLPLVGALYALMRQHQIRSETRLDKRIDVLFESLDKKTHDLSIDIRHRVENINLQLIASLRDDSRKDIGEFVKGIEVLNAMLTRRGMDAIIEHDKSKREEEDED